MCYLKFFHVCAIQWLVWDLGGVPFISSMLQIFGMLIWVRSMHTQLGGKPRNSSWILWGLFSKLLPLHDLSITFWVTRALFSVLPSEIQGFIYPILPPTLASVPYLGPRSRKRKKSNGGAHHFLEAIAPPVTEVLFSLSFGSYGILWENGGKKIWETFCTLSEN